MDVSFIGLLTNFGFAGITVFLIVTGMLAPKWVVDKLEKERDALVVALEIERQRNAELASTTSTTASLVQALTDIARGTTPRALPPPPGDQVRSGSGP